MLRKRSPSSRSPHDDQDHELTYWSQKIGVPREELRVAILEEGTMQGAVRKMRARQSAPKEAEATRRKGPMRVRDYRFSR
jgi:hypothetical protein